MQQELLEYIESYLAGTIDRNELEEQAKKLGVQDLDAQIDLHQKTVLAIESESLKLELDHIMAEESAGDLRSTTEEDNVVSLFQGKLLPFSMAAAIVVLLGLFFALRPAESSKLYAEFEFEDPGIPVLMSQTSRYELYDAMTYYSERDYQQTIDRLEAIQADGLIWEDTADYYLAVSYLYVGRTGKSIPLLNREARKDDSPFKERAEYLHALALLKAGETDNCKEALSDILAQEEHQFSVQAEELMARLN